MKIIVVNKFGKKPDPLNMTTPPHTAKRETFISKVAKVVAKDIKNVILHKEALIDAPPIGWEDYKNFVLLTKKR